MHPNFRMKKYSILLLLAFVLVSCSEYQKLLKSDDYELKYTKAIEYFDKGDYMRATTLFNEVSNIYKGTNRSEDLLNYIARSYMGQKDYFTAGEYYRVYVRTYPKGKHVQEAKFMIGYCHYLESPDARLDQTTTEQAIMEFQEFLDIYPDDERVPEANKLLDELKEKLAYKELTNARLYYNLGNYLGWNHYISAILVSENALKAYPATQYREDFGFLMLDSKYQQALLSVQEKLVERYTDTIDEYYSFINEFPDGKYRKQADRIFRDSSKHVENY